MASTNLRQDEVFKAATDAWVQVVNTRLAGYQAPFHILYSVKESEDIPPTEPGVTPWCRVVLQVTDGRTTAIGAKRAEVEGVLNIQVFADQDKDDATEVVTDVADLIRDILREHEGDVYLLNVRTVSKKPDTGYAQAQVMADVWWQEFRQ